MNILFDILVPAIVLPPFCLWLIHKTIERMADIKGWKKYLLLFLSSVIILIILYTHFFSPIFPNQIEANNITTRVGFILSMGSSLIYSLLFRSEKINYAAVIIFTVCMINISFYALYVTLLCYGINITNTQELIISFAFTLLAFIISKYDISVNNFINKLIPNVVLVLILIITNKYTKALLYKIRKASKAEKTYLFSRKLKQ